MNAAEVRAEIELGPIRPPTSRAVQLCAGRRGQASGNRDRPGTVRGDAFGRLILLHDPDGSEAWDGTMRLVAYIQADLDPARRWIPAAGGGVELAGRRPAGRAPST